ncbi:MAG: hypothetical protein KF795_12490 [Labilithrix sp.]|nr:hypothetical protein [Labilithrix sp.]
MKAESTSLRALFALGALAGALALTRDARGGDAPTFSKLPAGRLTVPSKKNVPAVSARESVPGVFVVTPRHLFGRDRRYVTVTADARIAAAAKEGGGWDASALMPSACMSQLNRSRFAFDGDSGSPTEWEENLATEVQVYAKTADNPSSGVTAIHSERIVEQNGAITLESVDAWVDPATRGARLISKASLPLELLREPAFGMKVYAGRDERPDGKRFVQFVVVRPEGPHMDRTGQIWAMREEGSLSHSSGCRHQRVAIGIGDSNGDTATVIATVVLPALDAGSDKARRVPPTPPAPALLPTPLPANGAKPTPAVFFGRRGPPREPGSFTETEVRTRVMHIQLSVSKTTREKEPLVSVSSSWGGREQVNRVVEPDATPL